MPAVRSSKQSSAKAPAYRSSSCRNTNTSTCDGIDSPTTNSSDPHLKELVESIIQDVKTNNPAPSTLLQTRHNTTPGSSHARRKADGHVPRPRNSFLVFRSYAWPRVSLTEKHQGEISRIVGACWLAMPPTVKQRFQDVADEEKRIHAIKYPNYKFSPTTKKKKVSRRKARADDDYTDDDEPNFTPRTSPTITGSEPPSYIGVKEESSDYFFPSQPLPRRSTRRKSQRIPAHRLQSPTPSVQVIDETSTTDASKADVVGLSGDFSSLVYTTKSEPQFYHEHDHSLAWPEDASGPSSTAFNGLSPLKHDVYWSEGFNNPFWLSEPTSTSHSLSDMGSMLHPNMGGQLDDYSTHGTSSNNHELSTQFSQLNLPSHDGFDTTFDSLSFSHDALNFTYIGPVNMPSLNYSLPSAFNAYTSEMTPGSHQYPDDGLGLPYPNNQDSYDMNQTNEHADVWNWVNLDGHPAA